MKFIGIAGSIAEKSYNRTLLQFIEKRFGKGQLFDFELLDINNIPMFNQDEDASYTPEVQNLYKKILEADGVIIATPEHNHTVPAALKSVVEWLSFKLHPFKEKPVMIVGASYYTQGSSRAQLHLRQILDSPGVDAIVMPGNEFLIGKVYEKFDSEGNLKDQKTVSFLETCLKKFIKFTKLVNEISEEDKKPLPKEDLTASGKVDTTIEGVDYTADDWVEQAAEITNAARGSDYVMLDRGILTVDQLNWFLKSMPMELTFADDNNQFLYYNRTMERKDMLAGRDPEQAGLSLHDCHPEKARKGAEWVIQQLRHGKTDLLQVHVPHHGPDKFVVHNYQALKDEDGNYRGINEYIYDMKPIVDFYLQKTGQKLVGGSDATSGASDAHGGADATSGASDAHGDSSDATSGASEY